MKAVVCGAGIAGLTLAERLHATGWDVVLLEKAPGPRTQGYMIDFFGVGYDAAEAMGALPRLNELGYQIDEVSFIDETGRRRARTKTSQFTKALGGRLVDITRPDLELALRERLPAGVDLRFGTSLTAVDRGPGGVRVTLAGGDELEADLLVGADGIHSRVRRLVFGEERSYLRHLGFHTAAYTFEDPDVRAAVGDRFCTTDTMGAQMGFYGLRDSRVSAWAVHRTADPALPDDVPAAVRREYGGLGWIVPRALAAMPPAPEVYYDVVAQIEMPRWSQGRVTLVGDACQAVSLLAGQGAGLAVAGSYLLADQLAAAGSIESGLERYERMWRPLVEDTQRTARKAAAWYVPESRLQLVLRRIAMQLVNVPVIDGLVAGALGVKSSAIIRELHSSSRRQTPVVES